MSRDEFASLYLRPSKTLGGPGGLVDTTPLASPQLERARLCQLTGLSGRLEASVSSHKHGLFALLLHARVRLCSVPPSSLACAFVGWMHYCLTPRSSLSLALSLSLARALSLSPSRSLPRSPLLGHHTAGQLDVHGWKACGAHRRRR
eukprot:COSAG03_NODE_1415_length_4115_cov_1.646165_4_plen_147_part_00